MTKISELDPLHEFTPTLDLLAVVHKGKTYSMRVSDFAISVDGSSYLPTTGGYVTGPLYLYDNPTFPLEAATKGYVDSHVQEGGPFLPVSGGQMLGSLSLVGDPILGLDAASKSYVDSLVAATAAGGVTVMEYTLRTQIASGDPGKGNLQFNASNQSDATQLYIDQVSNAGRDWTNLLLALQVGQQISIQSIADHNRIARWTVSDPSEDMNGYTIVHVTPLNSLGFPLPNSTTVAIAILGKQAQDYLPLSGGTMQGGISFGQRFGGSDTDLTQHISLYDGWGGFNITSGSLNIIAASKSVLSADGNWLFAHSPIYLPRLPIDPWEAVPKSYVDGNFAPLVGGGYVAKTGDQMSGPLILSGDPTTDLGAVPRQYLDNNYSTNAQGDARWVNVTGDTMTGPLALPDGAASNVVVTGANFNTGMFFVNNSIHFATIGTDRWSINTGYISSTVPYRSADGTANSPTYQFTNESAGLFRASAGNIAMAVGSAVRTTWTTTAFTTTVPVILPGDPTAALHAVPRQYLDNNYLTIAQSDARYVNVTGDVMTGPLVVADGSSASPLVIINGPVMSLIAPPAPSVRFIGPSANDGLFLIDAFGTSGSGGGGFFMARAAQGSPGAPSAVIAGQRMGGWRVSGYGTTGYGAARAFFHAYAAEAFTDTAQGTYFSFSTTAIGTVSPQERLRLTDAGALLLQVGDPTQPLQAVPKQYLDNNYLTIAQSDARYVNVTGDTMTGGLSFGEFTVTDDLDLSRHVMLFDGGPNHQYGFNVQFGGAIPAHFNYVAGADAIHQFLVQGVAGPRLTISGTAILPGVGIDFGSAITGNNNTDLTKHISLYPNHGINVSYRGLNVVAGSTYFVNNSITTVALSSTVVSMYVGLSFGGNTSPSGRPTDLSRHIDLFGGSYGFSVTNNRLNVVSPGWTYFNVGGTDIGRFDATGLTLDGFYTVTLGREPTAAMEAATMQYADGVLARAGGPFLPLTAGPGVNATLTGMLYLPHVIPDVDEMATPLFYVRNADQVLQDQISAVAAGNLVFMGQLHLAPDGSRDEVQYKYILGLPNGPLPDPTSLPKGNYFIVIEEGIPPASGSHVPPMPEGTSLYVRGDWFISDGETWIFLPLGLVNFVASAIAVDPPVQGTVNVQDALQWFDANDLKLAGGTMKGQLYLSGIPTTGTQAASKDYVDNKAFLKLIGGELSGGLSFGSEAVASGNPADTSRHITLWSPGFGFSITDRRLNYNVNSLSNHIFLVGGGDVVTINAAGMKIGTGSILTLDRDPQNDYEAATKHYVDAGLTGYLKLTGGNMTGDILMTGTTRVNFFNGSMFIGSTGLDRADIMGANFALGSWNGIGLTTTCPGQFVPNGMYGVAFDTRGGSLQLQGQITALNALPWARHQIQNLFIYRAGNDQTIEINSGCLVPSLASIANSGGNVNVNDRFVDAYGNIYTALAVSGGGVTNLRMDSGRATIYGPGTNPVALTATAGSVAFNVSVNLTWTMPTRMVLQHLSGQVALYGTSGVTLDGGTGGTVLMQEPTTDSHAVTKRYSDRNKLTGYPRMNVPDVVLTVDQADFGNFYLWDNPGQAATLTFPGASPRHTWTIANATPWPVTIKADGGGAPFTMPSGAIQQFLTDTANINPATMLGITRPDGDNSLFVATTEFVSRKTALYLPLAGGTMSGGISFGARTAAGPADLSQHIMLHTNGFGFAVTNDGRLNYNTDAAGSHQFVVGGSTKFGVVGSNARFDVDVAMYYRLNVVGQTTVGRFSFNENIGGVPPASGGGYLAWNASQGAGEVDFINGYYQNGGFRWLQLTSPTAWVNLMDLSPDGHITLWKGNGIAYPGIGGGGNGFAFTWNGGFRVYVDGADQGLVAFQSWVTTNFAPIVNGGYVAKSGDQMSGRLTINAYTPPWGGFNFAAQLVITGVQNNGIGIFDSSNANGVGIINGAGRLSFNGMPPLGDSTTPPVERLGLSASEATFSTPARITSIPSDTSAQLAVVASSGTNGGQAKIRFHGTFVDNADGGTRYITSLRSGMTNAWTTEFLDIWVNTGQNDTNSDANQARIARFQYWNGITFDRQLSVNGAILATGSVRGQSLISDNGQMIMANNAAYYFERTGANGDWRFVEANTTIFKVDASGSATIYGNATINGVSTFLNQPTVRGTNPQFNLDGPAASWRTIQWWSSGAPRWNIQAEFSNETGSNVGSDLILTRWTDAGAPGAILRFSRETGRLMMQGGPNGDTIQMNVPAGQSARYWSTVTNARTWSAGTWSDGSYVIGDESAQAFRLQIGMDGTVAIGGSLSVSGGINLNNGVSGPYDSSRGLTFWGSPTGANYSIVVSGGTLNYNVNNTNDKHDFNSGRLLRFRVSDTITTYVPMTVNGNLSVSAGSLAVSYDVTFGFNGAGYSAIYMNAAPNTNRITYYQSNGSVRWLYGTGAGAESGGNVGSDFFLAAYNDAGTAIHTSLYFSRATGLGTVEGDPTAPLGIATKQYTDNKFVAISGGNYVAKTGENISGALGVTNSISINAAAGNGSTLWLNAVAGQPAQIIGTRVGPLHWNMQLGNGAGTDDFYVHRYNDAGTYLDAPFTINRSTGDVTIPHALNIGFDTVCHNVYHDGTAGIMFRGLGQTHWVGLGWDGSWVTLYVDGGYQYQIISPAWVSNNFKSIGAYTPNQNVDNGSGPVFGGLSVTGDSVIHNVFCDGSVGIKYRAYSNVFTAFGWNGRVQCWLDGGGAYVELRDTRDYMPNQNVDVSAGPTFSIVWLNNNGIVYSPWNGSAVAFPWDGYSVRLKLDAADYGFLLRSHDEGGGWTGCHKLMLNGNGTCGIWWPDNNFAGWTIVWSDRRLKSNIRPATIDALGLINRLTIHELDLLPPVPHAVSQHWDCALIADEVEEVIPLAVVNYEEGEGYAQIREMPLIATMARAIQQLTAQNAALFARVDQLEQQQRMH